MQDIKQAYILRCLTDYLKEVQAEMPQRGQRLGMDPSGKGFQSIHFSTSESGAGAEGELYFNEYMRHVDMGVGRGHPLGSLTTKISESRTLKKRGRIFVKDRTYKPRKIYSPIAFGKLNWLEGRLMYGLTDQVIAELKKELEE